MLRVFPDDENGFNLLKPRISAPKPKFYPCDENGFLLPPKKVTRCMCKCRCAQPKLMCDDENSFSFAYPVKYSHAQMPNDENNTEMPPPRIPIRFKL